MEKNKASKNWMVNVVSFILLSLLSFTGIVNWLFLPKGSETFSNSLISLRHFFREVHEWTAVLFLISIFIHLMLHWSYIKSNLKKSGIIGRK